MLRLPGNIFAHIHNFSFLFKTREWVSALELNKIILFLRYVHSTILFQAYWKPIEIYCWNSLHQGRSVPRCWYMKLLLPLLKVKYDTRWHKLTILSIHTFNKFNSSPILRKSWGWHRISWTIFRPLFISLPLKRWEKHSFYFFDKKIKSRNAGISN